MKTLPKSLREKKRYLKIKIESNNRKEFSEVVDLIRSAIKEFSGEKGLSNVEPWILKENFDYREQCFIVKVNRDFENEFRAAIILYDINGLIYTEKVSGTLKGLQSS